MNYNELTLESVLNNNTNNESEDNISLEEVLLDINNTMEDIMTINNGLNIISLANTINLESGKDTIVMEGFKDIIKTIIDKIKALINKIISFFIALTKVLLGLRVLRCSKRVWEEYKIFISDSAIFDTIINDTKEFINMTKSRDSNKDTMLTLSGKIKDNVDIMQAKAKHVIDIMEDSLNAKDIDNISSSEYDSVHNKFIQEIRKFSQAFPADVIIGNPDVISAVEKTMSELQKLLNACAIVGNKFLMLLKKSSLNIKIINQY